jgi:multiple sugar transport system permease protein
MTALTDHTPVTDDLPTIDPAEISDEPISDEGAAARATKRMLSYGMLTIFAAMFIGPFLLSIVTSFKTNPDAVGNPLSLIPSPLTTVSWKILLGIVDSTVNIHLGRWTLNSLIVTTFVTIGRVGLASMAGYALARLDFPGRKTVFAIILAVMMVPGVVLLIPRFLVLKELSLRNSYMGMILPLLVDCAGIYLMKQNFEAIPKSVEEAAQIDGATIFGTWRRILLPMARPSLIALTILSVQGSWNEFTMFLVATDKPEYTTLTLGLANFRGGLGSGSNYPLILGAAVLVTTPIVILFFTFQRYFNGDYTKGIDK